MKTLFLRSAVRDSRRLKHSIMSLCATSWTQETIELLFEVPFMAPPAQAHAVHAAHHDPHVVQLSTLLSVKTGGCPEDCAYCPQAQQHETGVQAQKLMELDEVLGNARRAKAAGATRFYNHSIDTSPDYYRQIIHTRTFHDRLDTLEQARQAGLKICGVGMSETRRQRAGMLLALTQLPEPPNRFRSTHSRRCPHPARRHAAARSVRIRMHDRRDAHRAAAIHRAAVGGPPANER